MAKIDCFRELVEESAYSLSGSQHLGDFISCIQSEEKKKIKSSITSRNMSVIFYGTTTVCEAMVVIIWFVDDSWNICQRVVCLMWLASSLLVKVGNAQTSS